MRAIALVVQWIRTLDYGSSNKRSNRFESTNGQVAEWLRLSSAKAATSVRL